MANVDIAANLTAVHKQLSEAAKRSGRKEAEITVVAVAKRFDASVMVEAIEAGQTCFGENYVREARKKLAELKDREADSASLRASRGDLRIHLIGRLQRNKAKHAVEVFDVIETVDCLAIAEAVSEAARQREKDQEVLVQVNISEEPTKSGVLPEEAGRLVEQVVQLPNLRLNGLMSIGRWFTGQEPEAERRGEFIKMRILRDELAAKTGVELSELSMGMSGDFELAIEEGATIVRIGTAIFGPRPARG